PLLARQRRSTIRMARRPHILVPRHNGAGWRRRSLGGVGRAGCKHAPVLNAQRRNAWRLRSHRAAVATPRSGRSGPSTELLLIGHGENAVVERTTDRCRRSGHWEGRGPLMPFWCRRFGSTKGVSMDLDRTADVMRRWARWPVVLVSVLVLSGQATAAQQTEVVGGPGGTIF